jgi:HAD superfamily phosphatase (TIGR01681 family)
MMNALDLSIVSSFTSDMMEPHLKWWMDGFMNESDSLAGPVVAFQPLNTIMMQLLDPNSPFAKRNIATESHGFNVVMFRWEDVWKFANFDKEADSPVEVFRKLTNSYCDDLLAALESYVGVSSTPLLILETKSSPDILMDGELSEVVASLGHKFSQRVQAILGKKKSRLVSLIPWKRVDELYSVSGGNYYCKDTDVMGHVPYTELYHVALSTMIIRTVWGRLNHNSTFKVIASDADNTLWQGTVSEDGCDLLKIEKFFLKLQQRLVSLQKSGMLISIVSMNDLAEVEKVFEHRASDMALQSENIVTMKVNWEPKVSNDNSNIFSVMRRELISLKPRF